MYIIVCRCTHWKNISDVKETGKLCLHTQRASVLNVIGLLLDKCNLYCSYSIKVILLLTVDLKSSGNCPRKDTRRTNHYR